MGFKIMTKKSRQKLWKGTKKTGAGALKFAKEETKALGDAAGSILKSSTGTLLILAAGGIILLVVMNTSGPNSYL